MSDVFNFSPKHRIVRRNKFCVYCGIALDAFKGGEDEHVIGRRFVPKGTLSGLWNLIVRSCPDCNDRKAALENDISAVTMQPDGLGNYARDDERLRREATRKARTQNHLTKRRVSEPTPPLTIKGTFGPAELAFTFTSPAQADQGRMFELARLQLAGFFSLLTFKEEDERGYYWPGAYAPVVCVRKEDWGHPQLRWIETISRDWEHRLHGITADGFFKVWIRRRPDEPAVWAWALEWNFCFRLAGFFGDEETITALVSDCPKLEMMVLHNGPDGWVRGRQEVPLPDEDDHLFDEPETLAADAER